MKKDLPDPFILSIDDEGLIYDCKSFAKMLTLNQLIALKMSVDKTYNHYLTNNIDEDYINGMNNDSYSVYLKMINEYIGHKTEEKDNNGFVYLMRDNRNNFIKIGFSKKPEYREKTLQSEVPDIEMIYYERASMKIEKELHNAFTEKRIRGEWFNLDKHDINWIKDYIKYGA
jgi:hypothetical protein